MVTTRIYHMRPECGGIKLKKTKATTELLDVLDDLGFTLCKNCQNIKQREIELAEAQTAMRMYFQDLDGLAAELAKRDIEIRLMYYPPGNKSGKQIFSSKDKIIYEI